MPPADVCTNGTTASQASRPSKQGVVRPVLAAKVLLETRPPSFLQARWSLAPRGDRFADIGGFSNYRYGIVFWNLSTDVKTGCGDAPCSVAALGRLGNAKVTAPRWSEGQLLINASCLSADWPIVEQSSRLQIHSFVCQSIWKTNMFRGFRLQVVATAAAALVGFVRLVIESRDRQQANNDVFLQCGLTG